MCGIRKFERLKAVTVNYWFGPEDGDKVTAQKWLLAITYHNEPEGVLIEYRYLDDDGLMTISREFTTMADTLKLSPNQRAEISNIIVALNGLMT